MLIAQIATTVIIAAIVALIVYDEIRYRIAVRRSERQFWIDRARRHD